MKLGKINSLFAKDKDGVKKYIKRNLTTAASSGGSLIREVIDPIITDLAIHLRPEIALLDTVYRRSDKAKFRKLSKLALPGGATGEAAKTRVSNSEYNDEEIPKKVIRRKGRITGFLQETSDVDIDTVALEIENLTINHTQDIIENVIWGNADMNQYEFSGLDSFITDNRTYPTTAAIGVVPSDLSFLDDAIAESNDSGGKNRRRVLLMSPFMAQLVTRLQTGVRVERGNAAGEDGITIKGGWILDSYKNIPIVETSALRPNSKKADHNIGTVSSATNTSGGTIAANTYYFMVAPVTSRGEQLASAEVSQVTTGSTSTITLSWADVREAYAYRIYCGTVSGGDNLTFVREVSAFQYASDGEITGRITDFTFTSDPTAAGSEVGTHRENQLPYVGNTVGGEIVPPEMIMFWDLDANQGMGKFEFTNRDASRQDLISVHQFTRENTTEDWDEVMTRTNGALVPADQSSCHLWRGYAVKS